MKRVLELSVALAFAIHAAAGTPLFDFETEADTPQVAKMGGHGKSWRGCVTNRYATSGERGFFFSGVKWEKGMNEWPGFSLKGTSVTNWVSDWRGYDRLVFDMVSIGDGGAWLTSFCFGPTGGVTQGLTDSRRIPPRGFMQCVVPLAVEWPKAVSPDNVAGIHFFVQRPETGFAIVLDRFTLLREGEPLPVPGGPCVWRDILPMLAADRDDWRGQMGGDMAVHKEHMRDYWRFREKCGGDAPFLLGTASSMEKVLPRGPFEAKPIPADGISVRLARNEYESVQILVAPKDEDLEDVRVAVCGDLTAMAASAGEPPAPPVTFAATNIAAGVVGYVETKEQPPYNSGYNVATNGGVGYLRTTRPPMVGWWPDPILGFLGECDVKGADVQSFWVRVHCPSNQPAGVYGGLLEVSAKGVAPVRVPFSVRVNDFTLGRTSELPLAIAFRPAMNAGLAAATTAARKKNPEAPVNVWKRHFDEWVDFLADYLITYDDIYHFNKVTDEAGRERLRALARLRDQGRLGWFNIGHWWRNPKIEQRRPIEKWREDYIPRLTGFYEAVKELGIADRAYAYGCDEFFPKSFVSVAEAATEVKKALPDVPVFTTTFDGKFGVGSELGMVDWFCPGTRTYARQCETEMVAAARAEGRKVWWYVCDGPWPPSANFFIEGQAIEPRLLMGAQAVRMRPDGFLYYQITRWNCGNCIESGPFTDWNPISHFNKRQYHGDGSWTCAGPDGTPLPTIRLENFRDGLEDYAYAKLLERKLKELGQPSNGQTVQPSNRASWAQRARAALAVPCEVMENMTNYTDNAEVLYRWRDEMADLIEKAP